MTWTCQRRPEICLLSICPQGARVCIGLYYILNHSNSVMYQDELYESRIFAQVHSVMEIITRLYFNFDSCCFHIFWKLLTITHMHKRLSMLCKDSIVCLIVLGDIIKYILIRFDYIQYISKCTVCLFVSKLFKRIILTKQLPTDWKYLTLELSLNSR